MENTTEQPAVPPLIALHFAGERLPALLLDLSARRARVRLLRQAAFKTGRLVALSIADLPSFPGDVVGIEDDEMIVQFKSALHSSVVEEINVTA